METFKKVIFCHKEVKDLYLISNIGRLFSLQSNKFIKNKTNNKGYKYVYLTHKKHSQKMYIHRLVALHFIENKEKKPFVNHKDCNPLNNNVNNLEWVTHKENMEYASKLGRFNKTKEWKEKIQDAQIKKEVYSIDKITGVQKVYPSIQSVKLDGFMPSCVCQCCEGLRKSHKGKFWCYNE